MERDYEEVVGGLEVELGQLRLQLDSQMVSSIRLQLDSQMVSSIRLQLDSQMVSSIRLQLDSQMVSSIRLQLDSHMVSSIRLQLDSHMVSSIRLQLNSQMVSAITLRVRPAHMFSKNSNVLELDFSCSSIVFMMPLFWLYIGIKSRKEIYICDRPTTSGNNPTAVATRTCIVINSFRTP